MSKGLSVQAILSIALATLFIIAAALIIQLIFPYSTQSGCMKGQRLNIEEINSTANDAKIYGTSYTVKFKVEDCVECMWYNVNDKQLKIRWDSMSETDDPVGIGVSVSWNIGDNKVDGIYNDKICTDNSLKKGTSCVFEVTSNFVNKLKC